MSEAIIHIKDLKSPKGHFLLGNLKDFKKKNKHKILESWAKEYGEIYTIKLATQTFLISANPEFNRKVLRARPEKFRRLSKINSVLEEMGIYSVFNAEGADWKNQRKPVAEALNVQKIKGYYPIIESKTTNLIAKIDTYTSKNTSVEILNDFIAFTIDVTTEVAFGYKLDTLNTKENTFRKHLELIFPMINERIAAPLPIWRYFPSAKDKKLKESLKTIENTIQDFITEAKKRLEEQPELKIKPSNFLEALLVENERENSAFNDKTIYGNIFAILLAGEDTTSNTLAFTLFYLAQHPEIVTQIRKEAFEVYNNKKVPESYEQLSQLIFTKATIEEAVRLKPTTPIMFFQPNEDILIENILLKKDTNITTLNSFAQLQEAYFSEPQKFDPNRFIKSKCPYQNHSPNTVRAFGSGPRYCPGMHLSLTEMTTVISSLCKHFDFELAVHPSEIEDNFAFTVYPENLKITFKKA